MASRALVRVRGSGMPQKTFRPYDQDSLLVMPPSVRDWIPSDDLAAFINDAVETLDLANQSAPDRLSWGRSGELPKRLGVPGCVVFRPKLHSKLFTQTDRLLPQ